VDRQWLPGSEEPCQAGSASQSAPARMSRWVRQRAALRVRLAVRPGPQRAQYLAQKQHDVAACRKCFSAQHSTDGCRAQLQHTMQPVPAQASAAGAAQHQSELAGSLTQLKAALSAKIQGLEADLHARGKHAEAVSKQALELKSDVVTAQRAAEDARASAAATEERAQVSGGSAGGFNGVAQGCH